LSIPALVAAGAYETLSQADAISASVGWLPTLVATVTSFVVAYASIAWLLRLVSRNPISVFIGYRVALALLLAGLLWAGLINPT
jgi:undecaprenyl-diphosphatase